MPASVDIRGTAPAAILDAFADNFARGQEIGARFCAVRDGEIIADIWGGHTSRDRINPWTEETLACVFSGGKAALTVLVASAVSAGALAYDRPIAADWPAFAANGKEAVTLAMALSHQAGLCGFPDEMPPADWLDRDVIAARLAAMRPLWPPGSAHGYHPQTIGYIVGELLKRTRGRSIGRILREDYFARGIDLHCGLTNAEIARTAVMQKPSAPPTHRRNSKFTDIAFLKPWSAAAGVTREAWMAAEIPASNMHATARALAEIVYPLASGGVDLRGDGVLDAGAVKEALRTRTSGDDLVLPFNLTWTAGLMANTNGHFGPSRAAFGHAGFGGSSVMIDPARRTSAAYLMNKMSPSLVGDPRAVRLLTALDAGV